MRTRLIVAFIVVALLAAVATAWAINLIVPFYPWLGHLVPTPRPLVHLLYSGSPTYNKRRRSGGAPTPPAALAFCLTAAGLLLATITGLAFAASRRVLLPVRRLARAAQRMSGGDLSVRIEPRGRDEIAQLVTTFNGMAAALEGKVGELERMEARARQFAGDVSHELRTPLTAMTGSRHPPRPPGPDRRRGSRRATGQPGDPPSQPACARPDRGLPLRRRDRPAGGR